MTRSDPPTDVEAALREADGLREGDASDRARAEDVYARHEDAIRVESPEGAERVRWLLRRGTQVDLRLEPLLRRAAAGDPDPAFRDSAEVFLSQFHLRRGDLPGAEAHLRALLRRHRGSGRPTEVGAANNLAQVYVTQEREFETVLLARHAARLAEAGGLALGHAVALSHECAALTLMGEWDELRDAADRLEGLIPHLEPAHFPHARRAVRTARTERLLADGDHDAARRERSMVPATHRESASAAGFEAALLEARIALAEHRPLDGAAIARRLRAAEPRGTRRWLAAVGLGVRCLADAGHRAEAAAEAQPVLAEVRGGAAARLGTAAVLRVVGPIGAALSPDPAAMPHYGAASALLLARVAELQGCVSELTELSDAPAEDRALLARHRVRHFTEHAETLHAIARLHGLEGVPAPLLSSLAADGHLRVCAWCLTLRTADGREVPIGHLLPDTPHLGVTHGICDACRAAAGH